MKIRFLEVSLFKGFKKARLEFSSGLNLLVGSNNSGKSSLLQAVYLAFHFLTVTNGISERDEKSKGRLKGFMLKSFPLPLHDEASISEGLKKRSLRGEKSTYFKVSLFDDGIDFMEGITFPGGNPLIISSNWAGSDGTKAYKESILKKIVRKKQPLFIPIFAGIINKEEIKTKEVVSYYVASGKSSEVLRNQLKEMPKKNLELLNGYLKDSFSVEILSNETNEIYLSSLYKEGVYNNLDISLAGSGFQQILQILVYIVTSNSSIILIDEPDAHLHYKLQKILYDILTKLVEDGKQIIVATHSQVFIKNALEKNDRLILVNKKLENQKSINEYEDHVKTLYEDGLLDEEEITEKKEMKFIFLEDVSSGSGFKIIKKFLELAGLQGDPSLKILSSKGEMDSDIKYLKGARDIDKRKFKALIIKDSDSVPQGYLDKLIEKYKDKDILLGFLDVHEAENYLINIKSINKAIKQKDKKIQISDSEIKTLIDNEIKKGRDRLFDTLECSLEGKLKGFYRDINLEFKDIQSKTREIKIDIRDNHFTFPYKKLPGKEMFGIIKSKIHEKYKISLSEIDVASSFESTDVPKTLKDVLKFLD